MDKNYNPDKCRALIQNNIDFDFFKALFDPVRSELLIYLVTNGSKNIKDISENFTQDRSVISRHLELMYRYGIVKKTKENRSIFYEAESNHVIEKFTQTAHNLEKLLSLKTDQQNKKGE